MSADLTPAQARYLEEIRASGVKVYNGRARRTIEHLEALGLVVADYDSIPQAKGNGIELVERITVHPAPRPDTADDDDDDDDDFPVVDEGYPCGHPTITRGCGGCDPGAVEFVIDDDNPWVLRRPTADDFDRRDP